MTFQMLLFNLLHLVWWEIWKYSSFMSCICLQRQALKLWIREAGVEPKSWLLFSCLISSTAQRGNCWWFCFPGITNRLQGIEGNVMDASLLLIKPVFKLTGTQGLVIQVFEYGLLTLHDRLIAWKPVKLLWLLQKLKPNRNKAWSSKKEPGSLMDLKKESFPTMFWKLNLIF